MRQQERASVASGGGGMKYFKKGFSLMELIIVVAVIAILVTLSYPSYISFVRKADRSEAQADLLDWANRQEVWRADHPGYNTTINPSDTESYAYTMVSTATTFTLTATAQGSQAKDEEAGVSCGSLTLIQTGFRGPSGHQKCWGK